MFNTRSKAVLMFELGACKRRGRLCALGVSRGCDDVSRDVHVPSNRRQFDQMPLEFLRKKRSEMVQEQFPSRLPDVGCRLRIAKKTPCGQLPEISSVIFCNAVGEKRCEFALQFVWRAGALLESFEVRQRHGLAGRLVNSLVVKIVLFSDAVEGIAEPSEEAIEQKSALVAEERRLMTGAPASLFPSAWVRWSGHYTGSLGSHAISHQ